MRRVHLKCARTAVIGTLDRVGLIIVGRHGGFIVLELVHWTGSDGPVVARLPYGDISSFLRALPFQEEIWDSW